MLAVLVACLDGDFGVMFLAFYLAPRVRLRSPGFPILCCSFGRSLPWLWPTTPVKYRARVSAPYRVVLDPP